MRRYFFDDFDTAPEVERPMRMTYDGPLALAVDSMVFNVSNDDVRVRISAINGQFGTNDRTPDSQATPGARLTRSERATTGFWAWIVTPIRGA